jgi:hypothetical protein
MKSWITRTLVLAMLMVCIAGVAQAQSADTTHPAGNAPVAAHVDWIWRNASEVVERHARGAAVESEGGDSHQGYAGIIVITQRIITSRLRQ